MPAKTKTNPKGSGRTSREELGLPPLKTTSVKVEASIIENCQKIHGSLANALRFAAKAELSEMEEVAEPKENQPILIGHLNRSYGFKGDFLCEKGTPVYNFEGKDFFESKNMASGEIKKVKFSDGDLHKHIDFLQAK